MDLSTIYARLIADGCRQARYGDFVIVTMPSTSFAVTAQELQGANSWARARASMGNVTRDRTAYTDRFETILARTGSGLASKGSRPTLARIVTGMKQNGVDMNEWMVPHNVFESVEVKKQKPAADAPAEPIA